MIDRPKAVDSTILQRSIEMAVKFWISISCVVALFFVVVIIKSGVGFIPRIIQESPGSMIALNYAAVVLSWFVFGAWLVLMSIKRLRSSRGLLMTSVLLVTLLYSGICTESETYGDAYDYAHAAMNLHSKEEIYERYIYPPLLIVVLQPITAFGENFIMFSLWLSNFIALPFCIVLLSLLLERYGFSRNAAAFLVFFFFLLNAPLLRILTFSRVNLHLLNAILLSFLLFPRSRPLSALVMSLAILLKALPVILVIPFILSRDYRWISWLILFTAIMTGACFYIYGADLVLMFPERAGSIYDVAGLNFREHSVDSIFRSMQFLFGWFEDGLTEWILGAKAALLLLLGWIMIKCRKSGMFRMSTDSAGSVESLFPFALLMMLIASPVIWEHYPMFIALPFLLAIPLLNTPFTICVFSFAYLVEFILPTFGLFPLSNAKLFIPLLLAFMIHCKSSGNGWSISVERFNSRIDSLFQSRVEV